MKTRYEVSRKSQEFKALVENQTRKKIKVLRFDNGGEYTSKEFDNFCIQEGIKKQLTLPYNPHQNWVTERKTKSIIEITKSMIRDLDLITCLWAEACFTTMYILNTCPHRVLKDKIPEEAFIGKKLHVALLCFFSLSCRY